MGGTANTVALYHKHSRELRMLLIVAATLLSLSGGVTARPAYTAAVVEHAAYFDPSPPAAGVNRTTALAIMAVNLRSYASHAAAATTAGADIIVFPEDGLYGFLNCRREQIAPFAEPVPDPAATPSKRLIPCNNTAFAASPVLQAASCMAADNGIAVVMDMAATEACTSPGCPHLFNTQVAFDSDGTLLARFYKYHLFYEPQYDRPPAPQVVTFTTSFGVRFGMMVCFGIMFADPTNALLAAGVTDIAFSSWWVNTPPTVFATAWYQAYTRVHGVTLLAAGGVMSPAVTFSGSGVFHRGDPLQQYYNVASTPTDRLLIARVPSAAAGSQGAPASGADRCASVAATPFAPPRRHRHREAHCPGNASAVMHNALTSRRAGLLTHAAGRPTAPYGEWGYVTFQPVANKLTTVTASSGNITCVADVWATETAAEWLGVLAFDGVFDGAYAEHLCSLIPCASAEDCAQVSTSAAVAMAANVTLLRPTALYTPFPLSAVDGGRVLPVQYTRFDTYATSSAVGVDTLGAGAGLLTAGVFEVLLQ